MIWTKPFLTILYACIRSSETFGRDRDALRKNRVCGICSWIVDSKFQNVQFQNVRQNCGAQLCAPSFWSCAFLFCRCQNAAHNIVSRYDPFCVQYNNDCIRKYPPFDRNFSNLDPFEVQNHQGWPRTEESRYPWCSAEHGVEPHHRYLWSERCPSHRQDRVGVFAWCTNDAQRTNSYFTSYFAWNCDFTLRFSVWFYLFQNGLPSLWRQ